MRRKKTIQEHHVTLTIAGSETVIKESKIMDKQSYPFHASSKFKF